MAARAVDLAYGDQRALADATFALPTGSVTAVIGPNGSGKSTLLHAIAGLHRVSSGRLTVLGRSAAGREQVAYVPQHLHANEQLPISVREVVTMGRYAHRGVLGRLTADDRAAVAEAMARLDVDRFARRQLRSLSGGERQRVLVAQALAQGSPLLLLDEPLTGLDLPSQDRIHEVIAEERQRGTTVVLTTHSLNEAAKAEHILLLAGRIVAEGSAAEVLTPDHLSEAYGTMVVHLPTGDVLLDDTVHHHLN